MPNDDRFVTQLAAAVRRSLEEGEDDEARAASDDAEGAADRRAVLVAAGAALGDPQFLPPLSPSRDRE
jgi:hypothetical protein